jgi:hypothetical protein
MGKIGWRRSLDGWTKDVARVRGPIMGKDMFWVYINGSRYTPTGHFEDAVSFATGAAARAYADEILGNLS